MSILSPRIAPGINVAMARVAARFYIFTILLVACTFFLPHPVVIRTLPLLVLGLLAVIMIIILYLVPWDRFEPRVFTVFHLLSGSTLLSILVAVSGGLNSSYDVLFFLIILFSYFYNLAEMLGIAAVVTVFSLVPYLYSPPEPHHYAMSAVLSLFFFLGTYLLYGVTRFVLKRNRILEDLNRELQELYSITSALFKDMKKDAVIETLAEGLKDHLPTTYCLVLLLDDKLNMTVRIACPVRSLNWDPPVGLLFAPDQLSIVRQTIENRQPRVLRLESDAIDEELRRVLTPPTRSLIIVPIRIAAENVGVIVFAEERSWERNPFTNERIQLAVAMSRQVAIGINMWWGFERLESMRNEIKIAHDKVIKAERLATLGEVTRAVEHEINNPLNVIVNWAEVYREDATVDPEIRKKFQVMFDMAMRIKQVIRKLAETKDVKSVEFVEGQNMTDIE